MFFRVELERYTALQFETGGIQACNLYNLTPRPKSSASGLIIKVQELYKVICASQPEYLGIKNYVATTLSAKLPKSYVTAVDRYINDVPVPEIATIIETVQKIYDTNLKNEDWQAQKKKSEKADAAANSAAAVSAGCTPSSLKRSSRSINIREKAFIRSNMNISTRVNIK